MTKKDLLIQELEKVSDEHVDKILDFVHYLQMKQSHHNSELTIASEKVLAKDWLKPEEEDAWADL